MSFRPVFAALVIGFGLVLAGFLVNRQRPASDTSQSSAAMVPARPASARGLRPGRPPRPHAPWALAARASFLATRPEGKYRDGKKVAAYSLEKQPSDLIIVQSKHRQVALGKRFRAHSKDLFTYLRRPGLDAAN